MYTGMFVLSDTTRNMNMKEHSQVIVAHVMMMMMIISVCISEGV